MIKLTKIFVKKDNVFEAKFKLDYTFDEFFEKEDQIILNIQVKFNFSSFSHFYS